jgi:hypothetical protein
MNEEKQLYNINTYFQIDTNFWSSSMMPWTITLKLFPWQRYYAWSYVYGEGTNWTYSTLQHHSTSRLQGPLHANVPYCRKYLQGTSALAYEIPDNYYRAFSLAYTLCPNKHLWVRYEAANGMPYDATLSVPLNWKWLPGTNTLSYFAR